jgi:hypothetical protein
MVNLAVGTDGTVVREPGDLHMVYALPNARKRFRKIAGYVVDSYFAESFERSARQYDHAFLTTEEGAELLRSRYGVSSSVLRQGFDCLRWANAEADRSIDVIGFGRQPDSYHRCSAGFVTSRWLESLGAGCLVVGKRPPGTVAQDMFPWPDALVELPDDPTRAVEFNASLLSERNFISETLELRALAALELPFLRDSAGIRVRQ